MSVQLNGAVLDCTGAELGTLDKLPQNVVSAAGGVTSANFQFNSLEDEALKQLDQFGNVESLILDNNELTTLKHLPTLKHLKTLWLNKNRLENIDETLTILQRCAPRLTYLSLVMNPCAPSELTGASEAENSRYRVLVKYRLPTLQLLDAAPFTAKEAATAKERGKFYQTATAKQEGSQSPSPGGSPTTTSPPKAGKDGDKKNVDFANGGAPDSIIAGAPASEKKGEDAAEEKGEDEEDFFSKVVEERETTNAQGAYYTKQQQYYSGKSSEGNRFIKDDAL